MLEDSRRSTCLDTNHPLLQNVVQNLGWEGFVNEIFHGKVA